MTWIEPQLDGTLSAEPELAHTVGLPLDPESECEIEVYWQADFTGRVEDMTGEDWLEDTPKTAEAVLGVLKRISRQQKETFLDDMSFLDPQDVEVTIRVRDEGGKFTTARWA